MKMQSLRRLLMGATGSACALAMAPAAFADTTCDAVYQAAVKSLQTPYHSYSTTTRSAEAMRRSDTFKKMTGKPMYAAKTESIETVFDGKTSYLQAHGRWARSQVPQAEVIADAREKLKTHPDTCTSLGDRTVGGQAVGVYNVRSAEVGSDQQLRILKSSGLLQGGTVNIDGDVIETRYEYGNVQAPAGVQ